MPRPVNMPVECWQPIVSANPRGLDFMVKHDIKGAIGGGAATMQAGPIQGYQHAAERAGKHLKLGENLMLGIHGIVAKTREEALRRLTPIYEEHAKMFAPLGFVPGLTPEQVAAVAQRGGWDEAGVPKVEHFIKLGLVVRRHAGRPRRLHEGHRGEISGHGAHQLRVAADDAEGYDARAVPDRRRGGHAAFPRRRPCTPRPRSKKLGVTNYPLPHRGRGGPVA